MPSPRKPRTAQPQAATVVLYGVPHAVRYTPSTTDQTTVHSIKVGGIEVLDLYRYQHVMTLAGAVPLLTLIIETMESNNVH